MDELQPIGWYRTRGGLHALVLETRVHQTRRGSYRTLCGVFFGHVRDSMLSHSPIGEPCKRCERKVAAIA